MHLLDQEEEKKERQSLLRGTAVVVHIKATNLGPFSDDLRRTDVAVSSNHPKTTN